MQRYKLYTQLKINLFKFNVVHLQPGQFYTKHLYTNKWELASWHIFVGT